MKRKKEQLDPVLVALNNLTHRLDILIAFEVAKSDMPNDKAIRMLVKTGMVYAEIQNLLGVSSGTIARVLKKK